jgi:hypothetical protein
MHYFSRPATRRQSSEKKISHELRENNPSRIGEQQRHSKRNRFRENNEETAFLFAVLASGLFLSVSVESGFFA